ncbi:hypothetical protein Ancab_034780 [Ancistrocladus abbreviatus]
MEDAGMILLRIRQPAFARIGRQTVGFGGCEATTPTTLATSPDRGTVPAWGMRIPPFSMVNVIPGYGLLTPLVPAEIRREGLDAFEVQPMGRNLMLIKPHGGVNLVNEEFGLAVLTPVMHHISLSVTLKIDEDDFPIFIAEEGMAFGEKVVSWDALGTGSSEDSSEASFPSIASLSVVPESVEDDLGARKFTATALHREPNSEAQKSMLVINDSADVVKEELPRIDGQESGKPS